MKKLIPKDKQKLIYLKWQDAHSNGSWFTEKELEIEVNKQICICEDIGWVIYEDQNEIHLVSRRLAWSNSPSTHSSFGAYQRIPKAWILKRKVIVK